MTDDPYVGVLTGTKTYLAKTQLNNENLKKDKAFPPKYRTALNQQIPFTKACSQRQIHKTAFSRNLYTTHSAI
jgi:hypothetical protein